MATLPPDELPCAGQPAAVQAAFLKLRDAFVAGLPQRWAEIEAAPTPATRQQALHRLAGAAGSYGLHALGQAARAAEQALSGGNAAAVEEAWRSLRHHLIPGSDTL